MRGECGQRARQWMMRDGDSGGKRKRGGDRREKNNGRKKGTHCTQMWLKRDWIPLRSHAKWSTRMDDFNTIFANSIQFCLFVCFSTARFQRNKGGEREKQTVWWMKSPGPFVLDCDRRWKIWRHVGIILMWRPGLYLECFKCAHVSRTLWQSQICVDVVTGLSWSLPCYSYTLRTVQQHRCGQSCRLVQCVNADRKCLWQSPKDYAMCL